MDIRINGFQQTMFKGLKGERREKGGRKENNKQI